MSMLIFSPNVKNGMDWRWVVLTDDAVECLPVRGIKNPIRLARGEDKRSCKPVMIKHLEREKKCANKLRIEFFSTSPSGQTKVKLNPTGGAGCKSGKKCFKILLGDFGYSVTSLIHKESVKHLT